jgi:hypothetical protein
MRLSRFVLFAGGLAFSQPLYPVSNLTSTFYQSLSPKIPKRICGTGAPSSSLIKAHKYMRAASKSKHRKRASPSTSEWTVDTVFHIVSTEDQKNSVSPAMISDQFGQLQAAYAASNISFRLIQVDYTVNDTWATDENDADMKMALRIGNYSTLNIYFQTNLSTNYYGIAAQLLGYCTLPTNITYSPCDGCDLVEFPAPNYAMDGCNVHAGSMPNGALNYYNQGLTAVHEVGHWFGLLHTFQDNSCDPSDPGDYIDDTPCESVSTDGCPVGKDSCPNLAGLDPIHNYMDYSTDAWSVYFIRLGFLWANLIRSYESFTGEQTDRIQNMYETLRYGY